MTRLEMQQLLNYAMTTLENAADGISPPLTRDQARAIADDIDTITERLMIEGLEG